VEKLNRFSQCNIDGVLHNFIKTDVFEVLHNDKKMLMLILSEICTPNHLYIMTAAEKKKPVTTYIQKYS
jgi:hypothetical protein